MKYLSAAEARNLPGLRLVLTAHMPGPWGEAAKALLSVRQVKYVPVAQAAMEANDDLYAWTGVRNAPVAVLDEEPPQTTWLDILLLAERLGSGTPLLPSDPIERALVLWSNPGEVVLTPFMGVGSECFGALANNRRAVGIELKPAYYKQAVVNLDAAKISAHHREDNQLGLLDKVEPAKPLTLEEEAVFIDDERRKSMIKKSHQGC